MYIDLPHGSKPLDIDDVRLMEWRDPSDVPRGVWMPADALRAQPNTDITLEQSGCSALPG